MDRDEYEALSNAFRDSFWDNYYETILNVLEKKPKFELMPDPDSDIGFYYRRTDDLKSL